MPPHKVPPPSARLVRALLALLALALLSVPAPALADVVPDVRGGETPPLWVFVAPLGLVVGACWLARRRSSRLSRSPALRYLTARRRSAMGGVR